MAGKNSSKSNLFIQSLTETSFSSEDDFVDLQDFPKIPKNNSSVQLVASKQCARTRSYTSAMPQNKSEERKIISSYVASNLRRCQSSVSYQKKENEFQEINKENPRFNRPAAKHKNNRYSARSNNDQNENEETKGLCRKSSFDFIPPQSQRVSSKKSDQLKGKNNWTKEENKEKVWRGTESREKASTRKYIRDKSRESKSTVINIPRINLRDSAIDLVSDEEDSEAYTAVSLAGTLNGRNALKPSLTFAILRKQNRKFYIVIAVLCGVILLLGGLAVTLALILFR